MTRGPAVCAVLAAFWAATGRPAGAQATPDTTAAGTHALPGAQFRIPLVSLFAPGLGQFLRGAPITGAAFSATAVTGVALYLTGDTTAVSTSDLPRHPEGQQAFAGLLLLSGAGYLSAYDAFASALPALRASKPSTFSTSAPNSATRLSNASTSS